MSSTWIQKVVGRNKKRNRGAAARKRRSRRLRLQGLESRQLLAGDLMTHEHVHAETDPSAMVAGSGDNSMASDAPNAVQMSDMNAMSEMNHAHHMAHPAAMALVSADQATHTVVASGNWSDPNVWENQTLPSDGARIVIPQGMTLTVDSVLANEFKTIGIHGTLRFATDVNTELRVDTIVSGSQGRFEMGTAANPIANDVTSKLVFADDGVIDTTWDPEQLSRGAILHGPTEIHGSATTHQTTLAEFPSAGATSITLNEVPVNWNAGDEIVITGTQGSTSDEVRTIASIDGSNVTFDEPLQLDHIPPKSDLNVYVANKTRNVQFSSENSTVAHRGHIMLMHTLDVDIQNAQFKDLGRTDKTREPDDILFEFPDVVGNETSAPVVFTTTTGERTNVRGRYAVHFHRGGIDPGSTPANVSGSVVDGSPGWGFVNHSSNVDMINNVAHGVHGASFYTEVGDEIGSMVGNIAIRTVSPTFRLGDEGAIDPDLRLEQMDFGVDGDGYWLSGHMVSMRDNVSAGASGHGIIIWSDGVIEPDLARGRSSVLVSNVANGHLITGRETIPTWWAPLAEINNNESYGATIGFRSRYVHSSSYLGEIGSDFHAPPDQAYIDTLNPTVDGLTVWGSRDGVLLNYNERMSIKNARLIGVGAPYVQNGGTADTGVGIDMYNEVSRGPGVIENVSIEGFNMGILAPRHDAWQVNNLNLRNTTDMLITEARQAPRDLQMANVTFGPLAGTAVEGQEAQRRNIVMTADFDADAHQPFFFLMQDRVTLDGQQLYFNQQASDFVPITQQTGDEAVRIPAEMIGATNQQLNDRHGTSFGGAIIPSDATAADYLEGGVVGSPSPPAATTPPMYDVRSEGAGGVLVDPGTLTNFSGPTSGGNDDDDSDMGDDDENDTDDDDQVDEDEDQNDETDEQDPDSDNDDDESDPDPDDDEDSDDDASDPDEDTDEDGDETDEDDTDSDDDESEDDSDSDPVDEDEEESDTEEDTDDEVDEPTDEDGEDSDEEETDTDSDDDESDDDSDSDPVDEDDQETDTDEDTDDEVDEPTDGDGEESDDEEEMEADTDDDESEDDRDPDPVDDDEESDVDDSIDEQDDEIDEDASLDFHNDDSPTDVNNDGSTTALDALVILNVLNRYGSEFLQTLTIALEHYVDVNNDGAASAADALRILNALLYMPREAETSPVDDVMSQNDLEDEEDDELLDLLAGDLT